MLYKLPLVAPVFQHNALENIPLADGKPGRPVKLLGSTDSTLSRRFTWIILAARRISGDNESSGCELFYFQALLILTESRFREPNSDKTILE